MADIDLHHKNQDKGDLVVTPFQFFLGALKDHPFLSLWLLSGEVLNTVVLILIPYGVRNLIDGVQGFDPAGELSFWEAIQGEFNYFVILSALLIVSSRFSGMSIFFFAPIIRLKPRKRLFSHLHNHDMGYFQNRMSGSLGNKIGETTSGMAFALWIFTYDAWPVLILSLSSIYLLFTVHTTLAVAFGFWLLVYIPVICFFTTKKAKVSERISATRSYLTGRIVDVASNIGAVKAFANAPFEDDNLTTDMELEVKAVHDYQVIREIVAWFHYTAGFFLMVGMMYQAVQLYSQGLISLGSLSFVFTLILLVVDQARHLSFALQNFIEHIGQMSDGVRTIMTKHVLEDKSGAKDLQVNSAEIRFDKVCFHYPDHSNKVVINNLDLHIKASEKIGLIGVSGAGKSTLVNLIMRFYDIQDGRILIDGQNIAEVSQNSLRRNIAYIPQDTSLFHRSLMENIRYGDLEASDEKVIQAARMAHADEFVQALPEKYETLVGERGVKLSGGQRQRIAIARSIVKNAPILILDEATSALDSESEELIQDSFNKLMADKTVIAIAHRLSTIAHMDRLIVMSDGQVVEQGTHKELLARKGLYAKLWARQSGGFIGE